MGGETAEQPCDAITCKDTNLTGWKRVPGGIQDLEQSSAVLKPLRGFTEGMKHNLIRKKPRLHKGGPREMSLDMKIEKYISKVSFFVFRGKVMR